MRFLLIFLCALLGAPPALAWNAAGHRLVALIAWQQLSAPSRRFVGAALALHPDYGRWRERAGGQGEAAIFAEAATWADGIRGDPRYYDEGRDAPTPLLAGRFDSRRHRDWHYADFDAAGRPAGGQIDRQIMRLSRQLAAAARPADAAYALPWLLHLVADIHQPLHVGRAGDYGGARYPVLAPDRRGSSLTTLHAYWDDLPGPSSLRGQRLQREAARLLTASRPPAQGDADLWREESRSLHASIYPRQSGAVIDAAFDRQARAIADRRLSEAGYRLGRLLESSLGARLAR